MAYQIQTQEKINGVGRGPWHTNYTGLTREQADELADELVGGGHFEGIRLRIREYNTGTSRWRVIKIR